ncbi:MAG: response regulator transcription factor, partial [Ferruginibacter sp.]
MEPIKPQILLCEDDTNLGMVLKNYLELNDYDVTLERDGKLGLAAFQREKFDLCLLDVMMPNMDGFTLAEEIRDVNPDVPLFFLSAKTMKDDIIQGYKLGADDYITKPFDSEVLLHKIKAILKRNEELHREEANAEFDLGRYHFNPRLRELIIDGRTQTLSPKENELLKMLSEYKNDLLSREIALKKIWGSDTY